MIILVEKMALTTLLGLPEIVKDEDPDCHRAYNCACPGAVMRYELPIQERIVRTSVLIDPSSIESTGGIVVAPDRGLAWLVTARRRAIRDVLR